jgi:hypothetical protein
MAMTAMAATDRAVEDRIFVEYERLLERPSTEAGRLAAFLDARTATATTADTVLGMASRCESAMRHHRSSDAEATAGLTEAQRALYDAQRKRSAGLDARFDAAEHPMPPGWRAIVLEEERRADRSAGPSS